MKRTGLWITVSASAYLCVGVLLPIALWMEFGTGGLGDGQEHAGLVDYAKLYPHMVLYPLCWSLFAFANLALAFATIDGHGDLRGNARLWRASFLAPLILFALFAAFSAYVDSQNPQMMLFEIGEAAQAEPVSTYLEDSVAPDVTVARIVMEGVAENDADKASAKGLRAELFSWEETWKSHQDDLSRSRGFYLLSFAGIVWAMLATVLCAAFAALMPQKSIDRRKTIRASIGAAAGLMLWFPHRIYYNSEVRNKLFDPRPGDFANPIPSTLEKFGLTASEAIPLFFVIIFSFVAIVIALKKDPRALLKKAGEWLALLGVSAATLWTAVDAKTFGDAIGVTDGNWIRLIIATMILMILFVLYGLFFLHEPEEPVADGNTG